MTNAQRGQIAVLKTIAAYSHVDFRVESKTLYSLIHVQGVSRDGKIIRYRRLGDSYLTKKTPAETLLIAKGTINEEALIADMESKIKGQWDANLFNDIETLKDYVRKFK